MPESASSSASTYVAPPGDMFDIVLGATARRDVTEVQLFVHYLNLQTDRQTDVPTRQTHRQNRASRCKRQTDMATRQADRRKGRKKERKKNKTVQ